MELGSIQHIAVNCRILGLTLEGMGRYTYEMIAAWMRWAPDIKWSLLFDRPSDCFQHSKADRYVMGPATSHALSVTYWQSGPLTRWLNKHRPDIYISTDNFIPLRARVRCVPVIHDVAPLVHPEYMRWRDYGYYRLFQKRMAHRAWRISTVSEYSKKEIVKYTGVSSDKVFVIYSGLRENFRRTHDELFAPEQYGIQRPYFIYYGSIHPRKNVYGTICAYERYRELGGQADLVLCGRVAWMAQDVQSQMQKSVYKSNIHHIDYPDDDILYGFLSQALATIFISHYEGFGQPVLESMALGVPVITSADSAMSEIGGESVRTVAPLDHESIAHSMLEIERDPQLRQQMINRGLERSKLFTYQEESRKFLAYLADQF